MTRRRALGAIGAVCALSPAILRAAPRIVVAHRDDSDVMWADGGIAKSVLDEVLTGRCGLQVTYKALPWLRAQREVEVGTADALFTIPSDDRARYMLFTDRPMVAFVGGITYRRDHPARAQLDAANSIAELTDLTYNYYYADNYQQGRAKEFRRSEDAPSMEAAVRKLAVGRGDFCASQLVRLHRLVDRNHLGDRLLVRRLGESTVSWSFGLRHGFPDAQALIARIGMAGVDAWEDGTTKRLTEFPS
ncbi:MAG: hypothetical protein J0H82_07240 [Alphaproteobacteria bacterium]|jgi:hypothetical protein|nr:hypothetical protein [Alphaproteobacteria bacterium]